MRSRPFTTSSRLALIFNFLSFPTRLRHYQTSASNLRPEMPRTALLIGANRGIGLNLARALSDQNWNVVASIRPQTKEVNDPSVQEIEAIASKILTLDLSEEKTIAAAAEQFGDGPLDMLINIAGIGPEPDNWYEHTAEILKEKFAINTVGPFLVVKHFHESLKKAEKGVIVNISSNAGSITMCKGEDLGYRVSKAALNMMTVTLAKEFQMNGDNIAVIALNPGYVATRLTNFRFRDNMEECIAGIVKVVDNIGLEQTGTFVDWRGETLPW
ncbi:hypothetical protein B0T16DRAFT_411131 [Cercophora newfieldiana]|uniref:NAD(P)-binding protein n=1 Tax=Cercophora newfieldiana TaxID=92897 RepID=A0AA39Y5G0_9PEZI|nr:hypothetical protein B0T16DRAFT_411131 [Cercophora newfieldiana]